MLFRKNSFHFGSGRRARSTASARAAFIRLDEQTFPAGHALVRHSSRNRERRGFSLFHRGVPPASRSPA